MAQSTLPILFVNLGGEMLYVLTQRLRAQNIAAEKSHKVVCDIVNTMYGAKFLSEITRPQEIFARQNLRVIFEKLAHTSIMRLNQVSMDKLYDLMTMAVKFQLTFCNKPKDLLLVTYNHLDSISKMVPDSAVNTKALIENVYKTIDKMFGKMTSGQFQRLRSALLMFFQDLHVRVSVFLRDNLQTQTGKFIISQSRTIATGIAAPGSIRLYKKDQTWLKTKAFSAGGNFSSLPKEPAYGIYGDRVIKLGLNLYSDERAGDQTVTSVDQPSEQTQTGSLGMKKLPKETIMSSDLDKMEVDKIAAKELDILQGLLGHLTTSNSNNVSFQLDLFGKSQSSEQPLPSADQLKTSTSSSAQRLQVQQVRNPNLKSIAAEMTLESSRPKGEQSKGDDLLDLLDKS